MVDSTDPIKHGSHQKAQNDSVPTDKSSSKESYHSQYQASGSAHNFLKRMFKDASDEDIQKIFDLWMKSIASAIQQNQKFHEEQRQVRKEESGDDDEI